MKVFHVADLVTITSLFRVLTVEYTARLRSAGFKVPLCESLVYKRHF